MKGKVLVTGASGYIAGFVVRQLLEQGWTVHATVRNLSREAELRPRLGGTPDTLRFFAADLMADAGWADAVIGCSHVCHVASPFSTNAPKHEDDLIVPAREGVLRALRFARAAGVTRFVQTSSVAAIAYGHGKGQHHFTESDWTDVDGPDVYAYVKSKTIAERAARDWVAANGGAMEFVSVNPAAVLGPVWSDDFSPSIEVVRQLLAGALPGCPDLGFGIVDVRDCADLHVRALTEPGLAGERFISAGPFLKLVDVARVLKDNLGVQARKVPTRRLPDWLVRFSALFNPMIRQITGELGNVRDASAAHALERLGWRTRPVEESILDCARSLIERGIVKV
ncbi:MULTISPECIES: aldehyde reductase [unclassified Novosphingobium]|jgi:dihydroflavonol-4-reductase|uniref:SDR family oxidoreductase n=1 Tax=unclassified Novosphingobium TaxID=2644732 RepID=UPI00061C0FA6|nr:MULTISPECIES: aldehyde reductase [unclassified Novosphingobium]GAO56548.1 NADPH-dependent methylglyoxal reductase [Novosphingobium sp. MD-1]